MTARHADERRRGVPTTRRPPAANASRRLAWRTFLTFAALYAATAGARGYSVDGDFAYRLARDAVDRGPIVAASTQRELLRRWGVGLPALGAPFVAAADAVAYRLPPANSVPATGLPGGLDTIPLTELPPISRDVVNGPADAPSLDLRLPDDLGAIESLTVISSLAFASDLPDDTPVATIALRDISGKDVGSPRSLRAGNETAEWSWGDPAHPRPAHRVAEVAGKWDGNPNANHYRATLALDAPTIPPSSVHVDAVGPTGRILLRAVVASTAQRSVVLTDSRANGDATTADRVTRAAFGFANVLPGAAIPALMIVVANALGAHPRVGISLAVTTGLATLIWPYARLDFAETLATACAFGAYALRLVASRSGAALPAFMMNAAAGVLAVAAGVTKYTAIWFAPLVAIDAIVRPGPLSRRTVAGLFLIPAAFGTTIVFGTGIAAPRIIAELPDGLSRGWLGFPLTVGLASLLASSGKGLLWYAPPIILAIGGVATAVRQHRSAAFIPIATCAIYLLTFGSKGNWHGGGWGPRYLVPMVPFAMVLSIPVFVRACAAALHAEDSTPHSDGPRVPLPDSAPKAPPATPSTVARIVIAVTFAIGAAVQLLGILKHPNAYTIMFRDHLAPQLPDYGVAYGGSLAARYVEYFRNAKAPAELARPPGTPLDAHGTPLPARGLGHLIDRDSPLVVKIWPTRAARFALTLYFCNYDGLPDVPRHQNVTIIDTNGPRTARIDDFAAGVYATWVVDAVPEEAITIAAYDTGRAFPVISGLFFDQAAIGPRAVTTASNDVPLPVIDRATGGAWVGRYGGDGAILPAYEMGPRDAGALPPYVASVSGGTPVWVDTGELERSETALLYAPGFSPIVAHAWLLGNDLIAALFPGDGALRQKALASPPWRYLHPLEVHAPHPEYGLGIDLWPLAWRDWFASWPRVMTTVWAIESCLVIGAAVGLWSMRRDALQPPRR